jgi:hypothetical protein
MSSKSRAQVLEELLQRAGVGRDELKAIAEVLREGEATERQQQRAERVIRQVLAPTTIGRPRAAISDDLDRVVATNELKERLGRGNKEKAYEVTGSKRQHFRAHKRLDRAF